MSAIAISNAATTVLMSGRVSPGWDHRAHEDRGQASSATQLTKAMRVRAKSRAGCGRLEYKRVSAGPIRLRGPVGTAEARASDGDDDLSTGVLLLCRLMAAHVGAAGMR